MTRKRSFVLVFGLLILYLGGVVLGCYQVPSQPPGHDSGNNGIWLGHRWLDDRGFDPVTPAQLQTLAARCQRLSLSDLFLHVGPVDQQGKLPPWRLPSWQRTRASLPQARWLAWVGAPNAAYLGQAPDTFDLSRADRRQELLRQLQPLLAAGFAGIHYDFEPLENGDPHFLQLLEETRQRFPQAWLSVASPHLQPRGFWIPLLDRFWSPAYYQEVAQRCQQLVLMGYDTMQPTPELYRRFLACEVSRLKALSLPCQLVVGVPCYEDHPPYHRPEAETLVAGIQGARRGGASQLALYCEWTCDSQEWLDWEQHWTLTGSQAPAPK